MSFRRCLLVICAMACSSEPSTSGSPPPRPTPTVEPTPEPPPPPDPAAELRAAGDDPDRLCAFAAAHAGSPEAATAREKVAQMRSLSEPEFRQAADARALVAPVRNVIEAAFARGAADPCDAAIALEIVTPSLQGTVIEVPPAAMETFRTEIQAAIAAALRAIAGPWLRFDAAGTPTLRLRFPFRGGRGFLAGPDGVGRLAFQVEPQLEVERGGVPAVSMPLRWVRLPRGFALAGRDDPYAQQLRALASLATTQIPYDLHLAAPDPTLAAMPRVLALDGTRASEGCAGEIALAARNITIDPVARTLHADVVDRTYDILVEGQGLAARGEFEGACRGDRVVEEWTLAPRDDGTYAGSLYATWRLPPLCAAPCTAEFTLIARPPARARVANRR